MEGETFKIAEAEEAEAGDEVTAAVAVAAEDAVMDLAMEEAMAEEAEEEELLSEAEVVRRRRFSRKKNHISLTLISLQQRHALITSSTVLLAVFPLPTRP